MLPFLLAITLAGTIEDAGVRAATTPVFPVEIDTVNLTVTVRDKSGNLVTDLRPEEFRVFEEGSPRKLQLFGRVVEPGHEEDLAIDLGILFDTSESMLKELRLSQEAAVRFLDAIPRARELLTVFFDDTIRISQYDSENQQGLFERIHETKPGGNTALYDAIVAYLSRVSQARGRKVLVLLTDGEDSTSETTLSEVIHLVRASPVTIYPIAFAGTRSPGSSASLSSRSTLRQLADMTGGQVFAPTASRQLGDAYHKILEELSGQYVLGFVPDDAARDGRFRKLRVEVTRPGVRVRARAGYVADDRP